MNERPEFEPHEYFKADGKGFISRQTFIDHVRSVYDHMRKLSKYIQRYDGTLDENLAAWNLSMEELTEKVHQDTEELKKLYEELLEDGILDSNIQDRLTDLEKEYAPTLESLKTNDENLTAQLAQTVDYIDERGIDIKKFGVVGDGVTDDTQAIQIALDSGLKIFWSNGTYYFKQVTITKDNTKIFFDNDVILKSDSKGDTLESGAFRIQGQSKGSYRIINNVQNGHNKIDVDNSTYFSVGDFVLLSQDNPTGTDIESHRQKWLYSLLTISEVDVINGSLTFNENIPHSYQTENNPVATIIDPVKNVEIIGSDTLFDKMNTTEYSSHFFVKSAHNLTITGFDFVNGGGKGITLYQVHKFLLKDITHKDPTNVSSGHGYGIQITRGSAYGTIKRFTGYESRHGIDFAEGANNVLVKNSRSYKANFNGHGMNSKHITFVDCVVYDSGFSVGNYSFLSDEYYTFINCTVYLENYALGFGVSAESLNIFLKNCKVIGSNNLGTGLSVLNGSKNIIVDNLEVENTLSGIVLRGQDIKISNITLKDLDYNGVRIHQDAKNINIENSSVHVLDGSSSGVVVEGESENVRLFNTKIDGEGARGIEIKGNATKVLLDNVQVFGNFTRHIDSSFALDSFTLELKNSHVIGNVLTKSSNILNTFINGNLSVSSGVSNIVNSQFNGDHVSVSSVNVEKLLFKNNFGNSTTSLPTESENIVIEGNSFS